MTQASFTPPRCSLTPKLDATHSEYTPSLKLDSTLGSSFLLSGHMPFLPVFFSFLHSCILFPPPHPSPLCLPTSVHPSKLSPVNKPIPRPAQISSPDGWSAGKPDSQQWDFYVQAHVPVSFGELTLPFPTQGCAPEAPTLSTMSQDSLLPPPKSCQHGSEQFY